MKHCKQYLIDEAGCQNVGQTNIPKVYLATEDVLDNYQREQMGNVEIHGKNGASRLSSDTVTSRKKKFFESTGEKLSLS